MSTLSTEPPSLRMTLRNVSSDGATVRSSRVGSRMTMISYGRIRTHHLLRSSAATVVPWQEGYLRRQPAQATRTGADLRNRDSSASRHSTTYFAPSPVRPPAHSTDQAPVSHGSGPPADATSQATSSAEHRAPSRTLRPTGRRP